ncbi:hypothetical protein [Citreicoccus inhibens]|uniref:hypothetical protein n=1 Tax=Citreicoccus inhibens TaxID=2849499 RepID=UPI002E2DAE9B|nr:hypothetical protein [Citreicoccus inhibens]
MDQGDYSPCTFTPLPGTQPATCDDASLFDLSQCTPDDFGMVDAHGYSVFELRPRMDQVSLSGMLALPNDGGMGRMAGMPLVRQDITGHGFFLTNNRNLADGVVRQYVLAGCKTLPTEGRIVGCYGQCLNGRVTSKGTFDIERLIRVRGESESSGNVPWRSETFVAQGVPVDVYVEGPCLRRVHHGAAAARGRALRLRRAKPASPCPDEDLHPAQ